MQNDLGCKIYLRWLYLIGGVFSVLFVIFLSVYWLNGAMASNFGLNFLSGIVILLFYFGLPLLFGISYVYFGIVYKKIGWYSNLYSIISLLFFYGIIVAVINETDFITKTYGIAPSFFGVSGLGWGIESIVFVLALIALAVFDLILFIKAVKSSQ